MSHIARPSRRAVTGLGAAAALGLLAACGRPDETSGGESAAPAEPIAEGAATGSLTVWAMGAEGEKLPELLKGFQEQNPEVTVEVTPVPWDSAHDKFTSAIAAGTAPDVAQVGSTWMAEFRAGRAEPTPEVPRRLLPGRSTVTDDTVYGVPWQVETRSSSTAYRPAGGSQSRPLTGTVSDRPSLQERPTGLGHLLQPGGTCRLSAAVWSNGGTSRDESEITFQTPQNEEAWPTTSPT